MTKPIERMLEKLPHAVPSCGGWIARCPAHDDSNPSLSISEGDDGRALVCCHAGCKVEDVCAAIGLRVTDLMPRGDDFASPIERKGASGASARVVATYDYRDEKGELVFQVQRVDPKSFRQRRPDGRGGWTWKVKGLRVLPYRLPELLAAPKRIVFVVEGEKDVDNLAKLGVIATCNAGGAGKWSSEHAAFLKGRKVIVLPDNDAPGTEHARNVAATLFGIAAAVRLLELPGLAPKGDVSDWIENGGTKDEMRRLIATASAWTPDAEPWPEIQTFDTFDLPTFPTHVLPAPLRDWVEAESHATQTPKELPALLALASCSAAIARRVVIEPWPGWREPSNLYVAILLPPANRKSAVFADATKPIRELESEMIADAKASVAREASARRQGEKRLAALERKISEGKAEAEERDEAAKIAEELATTPVPVLPRLIADDATSEKLGMMLADQGGRLASMSPEGGVFDLMAGMYSKSGIAQFDVYLKGHAGDDLRTDRVGRESVHVPRPALTCAYAIQPQVIEGLAENAAFRGRGLLARFLYALPESRIGEREIMPQHVPRQFVDAYSRTVRRLFEETPDGLTLGLSSDARDAFVEWCREIEEMLDDGGELETIQDWGGKLGGATLRIAAVLHCVEREGGTIQVSSIMAAIEIARYLIPHAEAVLQLMHAKDDSRAADAEYLLKWIRRHDLREFTKRDAHQHGKRRFPRIDDLDDPLVELARRGYVRLRPQKSNGPGRPASPMYEVNPAVWMTTDQRSRNSRNSTALPLDEVSEDSENGSRATCASERVRVSI